MKKLIALLVLCLLFCSINYAVEIDAPKSKDGVTLTDFNFTGVSYKIVSDAVNWTAIDSYSGVYYGAYVIRASSTTSGECYLVATSTPTTLWNVDVRVDNVNTPATNYLDIDAVQNFGFPIRYTAGLKAKTSTTDLKFVILYLP